MTTTDTPTADDEAQRYRGGCRPGMRGCRRRCGHRALVEAYREARDAQQAQAEAVTYGYAAELASFYEQHPRITFRRWLEHLAAARPDEDADPRELGRAA